MRRWIRAYLGMFNAPPITQCFPPANILEIYLLDTPNFMGDGEIFSGSYKYNRYKNVISEIIK